jgi:uncharacterized membrane protein YcaP (DUF421 family)
MDGTEIFFHGLGPLLRILVVGVCYYVALVLILRAAGKRTLSRMNTYDMVITMALGSILGKVMVDQDISLSEGLTATALLIGLQYLVTEMRLHFPALHAIISSDPTLLFYRGRYLEDNMRRERIVKEEIEAAIHEKGLTDLSQVEAVILGANGQLSAILKPECVTAPSVAGKTQEV